MADRGPTAYLLKSILGHFFKTSTFTPPAALYFALGTTKPDPSQLNPGDNQYWPGEFDWPDTPDNRGYKRVALSFSSAVSPYPDHTGSVVSTKTIAMFPKATAPWGAPSWGAVWDEQTGGRMLFFLPISSRPIGAGQTARVPAFGFNVYLHSFGPDGTRQKVLDMVMNGASLPISDIHIQLYAPIPPVVCNHWALSGWSSTEGVTASSLDALAFDQIDSPGWTGFVVGGSIAANIEIPFVVSHPSTLHHGDTPEVGGIEVKLAYYPE